MCVCVCFIPWLNPVQWRVKNNTITHNTWVMLSLSRTNIFTYCTCCISILLFLLVIHSFFRFCAFHLHVLRYFAAGGPDYTPVMKQFNMSSYLNSLVHHSTKLNTFYEWITSHKSEELVHKLALFLCNMLQICMLTKFLQGLVDMS